MLVHARLPLLAACLCVASIEARAQGEYTRRAGAELRVLYGDAQRLQQLQVQQAGISSAQQKADKEADSDADSKVRRGLEQRLLGGLSTLDIVLRLADQERDRFAASGDSASAASGTFASAGSGVTDNSTGNSMHSVKRITDDVRNGDTTSLQAALEIWLPEYPLHLPDDDVVISHAAAEKLHQSLCAGCHDTPVPDVERPAYNLFDEAERLDDKEFFARLIVGVRGDRVTGLGNPFSDAQLLGLMRYYQAGQTDQ